MGIQAKEGHHNGEGVGAMKCQFVEKENQPCDRIAEVLPVLEMRPDWTTPPSMCAIGKMATCCAHAAGVPLLTVVMGIDFESVAQMVVKHGNKRPNMQFTTLGWKPIPPEFQPHIADDTKRTNGVLKPGIILPGQLKPT